ncbi:uncharacterized protein [Rutidosis leptorrhynchoides]|uniref:uncharacterized protein n=1 Tax=Rutidosis leptorrhynchoides TaxID=125765 RepID=UPI003A98FD15
MPIMYPKEIRSEKQNEDVSKSLNTDNISVNIPLVDVLAGMPNYGKFLKDLMARKGRNEQASSAFLEAKCAAIVRKNELPPKLNDPGSFIVSCRIDGSELFRLIDQSVSKPLGIIENLVVEVGKLEFPADFVVVDMIANKVVSIILGRQFLATACALTDWRTGKPVLRDRRKTLSFQTRHTVKPPPTPVDFVNVITSVEIDKK